MTYFNNLKVRPHVNESSLVTRIIIIDEELKTATLFDNLAR